MTGRAPVERRRRSPRGSAASGSGRRRRRCSRSASPPRGSAVGVPVGARDEVRRGLRDVVRDASRAAAGPRCTAATSLGAVGLVGRGDDRPRARRARGRPRARSRCRARSTRRSSAASGSRVRRSSARRGGRRCRPRARRSRVDERGVEQVAVDDRAVRLGPVEDERAAGTRRAAQHETRAPRSSSARQSQRAEQPVGAR